MDLDHEQRHTLQQTFAEIGSAGNENVRLQHGGRADAVVVGRY